MEPTSTPRPDPTTLAGFDLLLRHHPLPMWIYDRESLAVLEVNAAAVAK